MVLQRKPNISLLKLLESHAWGYVLEVAIQTRPPTPFPIHTSRYELADKKKKQDRKGKEVAEEGEVVPFKELEPQKGAKLAKGAQRKSSSERVITKWVSDHRSRVPVWNPLLELDDAPLPLDSSIQDFQKEKASYVVDALLRPLLLSQDMADLRTLKKHKVFLTLKRDLAMVSFSTPYLY